MSRSGVPSLGRAASAPPGTRMAAAGVPLRTLQEWMGHRDFKTTLIYADYQPNARERELVRRAFARDPAGVGGSPPSAAESPARSRPAWSGRTPVGCRAPVAPTVHKLRKVRTQALLTA